MRHGMSRTKTVECILSVILIVVISVHWLAVDFSTFIKSLSVEALADLVGSSLIPVSVVIALSILLANNLRVKHFKIRKGITSQVYLNDDKSWKCPNCGMSNIGEAACDRCAYLPSRFIDKSAPAFDFAQPSKTVSFQIQLDQSTVRKLTSISIQQKRTLPAQIEYILQQYNTD